MLSSVHHYLTAWVAQVRARPLEALPALVAVLAVGYTLGYPFLVATYPPITDLPFHASQTSILRHYFDPDWHFKEQFTLHPIEVPYVSMYAIGVFFATFMPITWATKAMAFVMLLMLPVGLAVLMHGMKKSPLLGLLGLGLAWGNLTHWGFLNFMGAIGLFAMAVGFTLLLVQNPTRMRGVALSLTLLAIFFTHIYRFPFAILSVIGAAVLVYPATRRIRPILLPLAPPLVVFGLWRTVRQDDLAAEMELTYAPSRLEEIEQHLFNVFVSQAGAEEAEITSRLYGGFIVLLVVCTTMFFWQKRHTRRSGGELWWGIAVTLLPLILAGGYLLAYLILPIRIGLWWYVYPREITTAVFIALAVIPDLPKQWWLKLPAVVAMGALTGELGFFVARQWHAFNETTRDFEAVKEHISRAPKLLYLVFDHSGSSKRTTPYIHLPAWVQAENGGWLSFHFIGWNHSPIRYRKDDPNVPPPTSDRWEWSPHRFRMDRHGAWFDEFLIRRSSSPAHLFKSDPNVQLVAHQGKWWLFRRNADVRQTNNEEQK